MARTWKHDRERKAGKISQAEQARRLGISRQALYERGKQEAARATGMCIKCRKRPAAEGGAKCEGCRKANRDGYHASAATVGAREARS